MRIDWYTKGVLTVIAVLLAVIAFRPYVSPDAVVQAQGGFVAVQMSDGSFFDTKTGDLWNYAINGYDKPAVHFRLTKLGSARTWW
jgi:hypothetical protein